MKKLKTLFAVLLSFTALFTVSGCKHNGPKPFITLPDVDYSLAKAGDILLEDGTLCPYTEYSAEKGTAIAVICREASINDSALALGLSVGKNLIWCTEDSEGYTKGASDLYSNITHNNFNLNDSLESYEILAKACSDVTDLDKYPAWKFCLTYGTENKLQGPFKLGWCLPTLHEYATFTNYETIKNAIILVSPANYLDLANYTHAVCNQASSTQTLTYNYISSKPKITTIFKTKPIDCVRAVYHLENNDETLAAPLFNEQKGATSTVTIASRSEGATICYKIDDGDWVEKPSPVIYETSTNGEKITAYTKKEGLKDSEKTEFTVGTEVY